MINKETHLTNSHKLTLVLASLLLFLIFMAFLNQDTWVNPSIHSLSGTIGYRQDSWTLQQGETVLESQLELPCYKALESGNLYTLTTILSYDGSKDESPYCFFHLDHIYCRVLLDDEILFTFMPEDLNQSNHSKSPGFIYKAFPLPRDCMGKELKVELLPQLNDSVEYGLPDLQFGDYTSSLRYAIKRDAPHDLMMLLCFLLGVGALFFAALYLHGSDYREGLSIGIFCILFSVYMITECRINTFYIGNPYYLYLLNYIGLSALPISFMCFMRERLPERYHTFWNLIITAASLFFVSLLVLHFSGIYDLKEAVFIIHVVAFCEVALIMMLTFTMENLTRKTALLLQSSPLIVGMLLDILIYRFHWKIRSNDATFTIIGVLIFLVIEILHIWRISIGIYADSVRGKLYRQTAYVDELTGVGNRRAYDEEIDHVSLGKKSYRSLTVVSADVNRLKYVNDNFGHAAGDNLIASAAKIMKTAIGKSGKVFRTGGDEFALFLYDVGAEEYKQIIQCAQKDIASFNVQAPYDLSLAVGCSDVQDKHIIEAFKASDQKMYADKAAKNALRIE